jgi:RNA polymerase sigma-70 factor (ECF subfamily)
VATPGAESADPKALLERIAAEDQKALEAFYGCFEHSVYSFALSRLNDPHAAADVLNEVMLEVWRRAASFEGRSKVSTWVLGIAHHKIIDHFRKVKRHAHEELDPEIPDESDPTAADILSAVEDSDQLRHCLEELSDAHRQVVHLAFFEDLHYADIARLVGCPEGTVKTRMFHAKAALKRCLRGLGFE